MGICSSGIGNGSDFSGFYCTDFSVFYTDLSDFCSDYPIFCRSFRFFELAFANHNKLYAPNCILSTVLHYFFTFCLFSQNWLAIANFILWKVTEYSLPVRQKKQGRFAPKARNKVVGLCPTPYQLLKKLDQNFINRG